MFRVKARIEYGLMIMTELADRPGRFVSLSGLAKQAQVSSIYLIQIARSLARAGLLKSKEGARGGYMLTRPADRISLLEIMEAIDGQDKSKSALKHNQLKFCCHNHGAWGLIAAEAKSALAKKTLASLLRLEVKTKNL
ncbi:MAG: Rrf2 family transcriptional regulator [Patescibacteria group bacterium]